ncbi:MAG: NAD(P)H-dependent glycerol-3-phosphate dehydrogenase [Oscillatoriales cyanobacterium SM2_2_1]|nr:NAD(P)H-dependent glycerol-3-phosphate dehydrogenase [Oscillatoriales cyanobacterium SM2_2_1]
MLPNYITVDCMSFYPVSILVLGAGAWGSALAQLASTQGHRVILWSRRGNVPLGEVVSQADVVISAVSMVGLRSLIESLPPVLPPTAIWVTATKGLELGTGKTPSQLWQSVVSGDRLVVLSGPNLSLELVRGLPAATVAASHNGESAERLQTLLASRQLRVYTNNDPLGVELGGTLKNVMAIAVGVCDGLHLGANARAALITRALPEMIRVGVAWGARAETFWGLSGLGDLLATCTSPLSRNYRVGLSLAMGQNLEASLAGIPGTAEGVNTALVLDRMDLTLPITHVVAKLLRGEQTPQQSVAELMERDLKQESL